jgi:GNAT superfamily N-acetyltransferase
MRQSEAMTTLLPDEGEELTTGWEPSVDPHDSLVRGAVLAHASWAVAQARALGRPWRDDPSWAAGQSGDRGAMTNLVVVKQPLLDLAGVIDEVDDLFDPGVPFLFVSPWPTPDLGPLRLNLVGHPPLMLWLPSATDALPQIELDVRWVSDAAGLADAEWVLVEGYPMPELQPFTAGTLYAPALLEDGATRIAVVYDDDGRPAATAAAHSAHGMTLVEAVAVLPSARGRGAGAAVTSAATTGFAGQPAVLLASDDGQPVYQRLGYHRIERWTVWLRTP